MVKVQSGGQEGQKSVEDFEVLYYLSFALKYANETCILHA